MDKITLEQKYLNLVNDKKTAIEIREELQKEAVLNGWFSDSLPGEIRSTLSRLFDKGILGMSTDYTIYKKDK